MPINFPTSLDSLTNPQGTDDVSVVDHASQHSNANDILEALEAKVGVDNSAVTTSLDYKVAQRVVGPASSTDNSFAIFDSTTGKIIKEASGVTFGVVAGQLKISTAALLPLYVENVGGVATRLLINHATNTGFGLYIGGNPAWSIASVISGVNGDLTYYNDAYGDYALYVNGDTNNVDIGNATNPTYKLTISDGVNATLGLHLQDTTIIANQKIGLINFFGDDTQLTTQKIFANIEVQATQAITTDAAAGRIIFRTTGTTAGGSPVERMRIDEAGDVTIGASATSDGGLKLQGNGSFTAITGGIPLNLLIDADPTGYSIGFTNNAYADKYATLTYASTGALTFATEGTTLQEAYIGFQIQADADLLFGSNVFITPAAKFHFYQATDSASLALGLWENDSATPVDGDEIYFSYRMSDSGGTQTEFARMSIVAVDQTSPEEDGRIDWAVITAGTLADELSLDGTHLFPSTSDALALGDGLNMWSDFYLASGGVIDWGNGQYSITQSGGTLTFNGSITLSASEKLSIGASLILDDAAGTTTLKNIDALDPTTESTIEAAIDTLANLTSAASLATVGTITTGVWNGTDIAVADGGTGASSAADARTNLGLVAGGAGDIWVEKAGDTMTGALTLAGTPATAGAVGYNTTQKMITAYGGATAVASPITMSLASGVGTQTLTNSTASDQDFTSVYTFPANSIYTNKVYKVSVFYELVTGTSAVTLTLYLKLGSTKVFTASIGNFGDGLTRSSVFTFYIFGRAAAGAAAAVSTTTDNALFNANISNTTDQPVNLATNGTLAVTPGLTWSGTGSTESVELQGWIVQELN